MITDLPTKRLSAITVTNISRCFFEAHVVSSEVCSETWTASWRAAKQSAPSDISRLSHFASPFSFYLELFCSLAVLDPRVGHDMDAKVATLKCGVRQLCLRRIGVRGQKSLKTAAVRLRYD